ncbi:MAG: PAS domain S-box protein, partial [Burkholderiaceae bacterium]
MKKSVNSTFNFLSGGGEMGALMRAHDWTSTSLGSFDTWPATLKTSLRLLLTSNHPMFIFWGPELIQFYNDAYSRTLGPERHPSILGKPGRTSWKEVWDIIGPDIDLVLSGKGATWHEHQLVPSTRHGKREDIWWTYGFSPIEDESGVCGVLIICNDVTQEHRHHETLRQLNQTLEERVKIRAKELEQARQEAIQISVESEKWRRLYETVLSNTPDLVYVFDLDHRFTYANDGLLKLWGKSWDDAIGKNCIELGYEPWHAEMHDREIEQVKLSRQPLRGEVPFTGTAGRRVYEYIFVPVLGPDGEVEAVAGTTRDITERKHIEDALRKSQAHLSSLFEQTSAGVCETDLNGQIISVNERY